MTARDLAARRVGVARARGRHAAPKPATVPVALRWNRWVGWALVAPFGAWVAWGIVR